MIYLWIVVVAAVVLLAGRGLIRLFSRFDVHGGWGQ